MERVIEEKWQKRWEEARIFEAYPDEREKIFVTFPYPYVNGRLHLGHFYTFMRAEVFARYKRMKGFNVLFPQGFHATGAPIAAAARRLREGDPKQWKIMRMLGFTDEEIEKFKDPWYWIKYFMDLAVQDLKDLGASIDWRRTFHTTELNPHYDAFIRWQYRKLRKWGLIKKGKHPVVWCPKEKIPVGDHDRSEGEGVVPEEIIVIKFEMDGKVLPAATYRPETVYGVTNMWVNPEATYVEADVDGETWIISKEAVEKLKDQERHVKIIRTFKGEELVGKNVKNPVTGEEVPILPASFVDPDFATGVVMSVPAHAPYDWIALQELGFPVKPRSIILLEGFSEFPARDMIERYGIRSQEDRELLDKATAELYKKEYYEGQLREIFGDLAGKTVQEAKEELVWRFLERGWATKMWILPEPVICRCGAKCTVKIVDQWFLAYSDPEWKERAKKVTEKTRFTPSEVKKSVMNTIDWLRDWACTRSVEVSMGTRLPWDESQYIESLSDSTIYMAYYTISHIIKQIPPEKLSDAVFDYVFGFRDDVDAVVRETGIDKEILERMRREFEYWYPVDLRVSGKDLIQNHVTFSIFHHAVFFPERFIQRWGINGWVLVRGEKMSKSKGNFITIRQLLDQWGADVSRFVIASMASADLNDPNFDFDALASAKEQIKSWFDFVIQNYGKGEEKSGLFERWVRAEVNRIIKEVDEAYEGLQLRDVIQKAFHELTNILKKYVNIGADRKTLMWALETQIKLLSPIIPHTCEELWERIGKRGFVSIEQFPEAGEVDNKAIAAMDYVERLIDDIRTAIKLAKIGKPREVVLALADKELYITIQHIFDLLDTGKKLPEIVSSFPREKRKEIATLAQKVIKGKIPRPFGTREEEIAIIEEAKEYIERVVGVPIVLGEERKERALPFRPAITVR